MGRISRPPAQVGPRAAESLWCRGDVGPTTPPLVSIPKSVRWPDDPAVTAAPPPATPLPSLDAEALARLRELDPDGRHGVVQRVLGAFETSLMRTLSQLVAEGQRAGGGNADVVSGIAHKLKSGAASVGALELSAVCTDVERRLRNGEVAHLSSDIERLLAAGRGVLPAVASMLRP